LPFCRSFSCIGKTDSSEWSESEAKPLPYGKQYNNSHCTTQEKLPKQWHLFWIVHTVRHQFAAQIDGGLIFEIDHVIKNSKPIKFNVFRVSNLEATPGFEPGDRGFAGLYSYNLPSCIFNRSVD
jgi:hypothetical protein